METDLDRQIFEKDKKDAIVDLYDLCDYVESMCYSEENQKMVLDIKEDITKLLIKFYG
jgi:hypothetical protein